MAQARLIVVGASNRLTSPCDHTQYDNGRRISFPKPGEVFRWGPRDANPESANDPDANYGLMIFDDWIIKEPMILQDGEPQQFRDRIWPAELIAQDLERRFRDFGVLQIKGSIPTEEELQKASAARKRLGQRIIAQGIQNYNRGLRGMKGYKPEFDGAVDEWSKEIQGVSVLEFWQRQQTPAPVIQMPPQAAEPAEDGRVPCPQCGEAIMATAKVCHFCKKKFSGKTVQEFSEEPQEVEA